ncbi:MAG: hypothetical protein ACOYN0_04465 [Phycisphaerales bacterium]
MVRAIGALPSSATFVLAADDLGSLRATPAAQACFEFVRESGLAAGSLAGWDALAGILGTASAQSMDDLLGRQALLVMDDRGGRDQLALLTLVSPQTEARVRSRLEPVPREVDAGQPVLSLENGRFDLKMLRSGDGCAALLLTPRGSEELGELLLPAASGEEALAPLSSRPFWPAIATLDRSALVMLMTSSSSPNDYCVAGISASGDAIHATLRGSAAMMLPSAFEQGLVRASGWPERAADELAEHSRLMVAGYTHAPIGAVVGAGMNPQTLLHRAIAMLRLPDEVAALIDGPALLGVGEVDSIFSAAIPTRDLARFAPLVDKYSRTFAKGGGEGFGPGVSPDSVRVLTLGDGSKLIEGGEPLRGAVAWCFTPDPTLVGAGWWTLSLRTGDRADATAVASVRKLHEALSAGRPVKAAPSGAEPAGNREVFRLRVRPAQLATSMPGAKAGALRWLEQVESTVSLDRDDLAVGSVTVTFDTSLLSAK